MATNYKNIVITPNRDTDAANVPVIRFSGGDASTNTDINVRVYTSQSGTLSFEGSAGQLFSITNDLTNSIFSVNDVSGIPSIDVYANGNILLAPFGGQVFVGNTANLNFDSTASTKIVDPAANTLAFYTAQTEHMRISSDGKVLVGTSSSLGDARVQSTGNSVTAAYLAHSFSTAQREAIRFINGNGEVGSIGMIANTITLKTADTNRMAIDAAGNVLVGRTDSTVGSGVKLDVAGAANASNLLVNGNMVWTPANFPVATQADLETATSTTTVVTPGRQQFHPSASKFWVKAGVAGETQSTYNMTSVTDTGIGRITLTIATDFSSTNWVCVATAYSNTLGRIISANANTAVVQSVTAIELECRNTSAVLADPNNYFAVGFGDQ